MTRSRLESSLTPGDKVIGPVLTPYRDRGHPKSPKPTEVNEQYKATKVLGNLKMKRLQIYLETNP